MLRYLLISIAVLMTGVLTGCGLSPQYLQPEPRFSGQLVTVGTGQPVTVQVTDGRSSTVLGTRGGLYADSSAIRVNKDAFLPRLQAETDAAVRMLGFTPMPKGVNNAQLNLQLVQLSYSVVEKNAFSKEAQLEAVYSLEVKNAGR